MFIKVYICYQLFVHVSPKRGIGNNEKALLVPARRVARARGTIGSGSVYPSVRQHFRTLSIPR